jgi:hypothetical protein
MAAIDLLAFATAAGFAMVAAATVLVVIGVRQEERHGTIEHKRPPSIPALLARRVLGNYVRQRSEGPPGRGDLGKEVPAAGRHVSPPER